MHRTCTKSISCLVLELCKESSSHPPRFLRFLRDPDVLDFRQSNYHMVTAARASTASVQQLHNGGHLRKGSFRLWLLRQW